MNAPPSCPTQYPHTVCVDQVTGDTYIVWTDDRYIRYQPFEMNVYCCRFHPMTRELELVWSHPYIGTPGYPRFDLVHDGRWYYLFQTDDNTLHLRVDDERSDRLTLKFGNEPNNRYLMHTLMGVREGRLLFAAADNSYDTDGYDLYSMDINTFQCKKLPLFDLQQNIQWCYYARRGDVVYCLQERYEWINGTVNIDLFTYHLESQARTGPTPLFSVHHMRYGGVLFAMDSEGNLHLLTAGSNLTKYSVSGEVLGTTVVEVPTEEEGVYWSEQRLMVNGSDRVYLLGAVRHNHSNTVDLMSCTMAGDYEGGVLHHNISIRADVVSDLRFAIDKEDRIIVAFYEQVETHYRLAVSMQIDPPPDLCPRPSSFRMQEFPGTDDPVRLSVRIANVGRASSNSHWVSISKKASGSLVFYEIDRVREDVAIDPGGNHTFFHRLTLPRGIYHLRIAVEDVSPFENVRDNNAIEVMVHVHVNNPPVVIVTAPLEGATVQDALHVSGSTWDIDGDEGVITHITGIPGVGHELPGTGDWNATIDLTGVPSGDYLLAFQASDGLDLSAISVRRVRVDRPEESLLVHATSPPGDVTLLTGEARVLQVNVSDRFGRPVTFGWAIEGARSGSNTSFYLFDSDAPGLYRVEVRMSNGMTTMTHVWNVTVRTPTPPSILSVEPGTDVVASKGEELGFEVHVSNPDGQAYEVLWFRDGALRGRGGEGSFEASFSASGDHDVSVVLMSPLGEDDHTWAVRVENRPPVVMGRGPQEPEVFLEGSGTQEFFVTAEDPDGDLLSYSWRLVNVSGPRADRPDITLAFKGGRHCTVSVDISDGEDVTTVEWRVEVPPGEGAGEDPWADFPWEVVLVPVVLMVLSLGVIYYVRLRERTHRKEDGGDGR